MLITRVETLDHAKALVDCFYATYGLTFHRDYVYDPDELLELNREGSLTSFIAIEAEKVLGHLAVFQPFYEITDEDGLPISDPDTKEIGLSMVVPEARRQGLQATLGLAMQRWAREQGIVGAFMKCVTHHTFSQRSAFAAGGTPVALSLGGVPRWISHQRDPNASADPISTVMFYVPVRMQETRPIALTPSQSWIWDMVRSTRVRRHSLDTTTRPDSGPTRMHVTWQGERRVAFIHVMHAGCDIAERLREQLEWLRGGHIEHVTAYLPADSAAVARQAPRLAELGLFLGGWIPALYRGHRDALVYQMLTHDIHDPGAIRVHSDRGDVLKQRVIDEWQATRRARQAA